MNRIRDNAPPLTSEGPEDMRTDTTSTTEDARTIDAQEQTAATVTTSTPATSGHIEAQEPRKESRKRRKDNTSREAHDRYILKAYDRLELKLIAGDKARLQAAAAKLDISPTALIIRAVNAYTDAETLTEKAKNPYI